VVANQGTPSPPQSLSIPPPAKSRIVIPRPDPNNRFASALPDNAPEHPKAKDEDLDTLLPEETEEALFSKGTDGYKAIAGCETGKAKWMLAAQLGKEISQVKLEKEIE
jgi:hypothetical protein